MQLSYIQQKLDPILHPMTTQTFLANPPDHIEFMMQYMQENHGRRPGINTNDRNELQFLRKEVQRLKQLLGEAQSSQNDSDRSDSQISSEEDDEIAELVLNKPTVKKGPRQSVSAEAFGNWNKKEDF